MHRAPAISTARTVRAPERLSEFVALVIEPGPETIARAYDLARQLLPGDAESALAPGRLPHVTLTQCAVREAPRERLAEFAAKLGHDLAGMWLPLHTIAAVAGGFPFWCVDEASPERQALQRAHEFAITVADGLLDPVANATVVDGTRRLTANDPVLVSNAQKYGYAFIGDAYRPHITLGFDPRVGSPGECQHEHSMAVAGVSVVKLGRYGQVEHRYMF